MQKKYLIIFSLIIVSMFTIRFIYVYNQKNSLNTFMFNNNVYIVTNEKISEDLVDEELGKITCKTNKYPKTNLEASKLQVNTPIYEYKDSGDDELFSVKIIKYDNKYYVCRKIINN
ncbi:hypothetical protein [Clostridium weizhouense]|uniref:Uncharacterized protein n=1 Tax=Clostridium weizhouense TaxID=2859781 RepID=A0ABS7ANG2_9CLOT|nr:hypothetical protein [Clostridium weizhouense]MBW6410193.1 hypothetical protein [Clostridium weizhouense]